MIYSIAVQRKSLKKWRKKPFPLYGTMAILVNGIVATGSGAFNAGTQSGPTNDWEAVMQPDPSNNGEGSSGNDADNSDGVSQSAEQNSEVLSSMFNSHKR